MDKFTVEESNLISIFDGESRTEVIRDIELAMKYLEDDSLLEISEKVIEKLKDMTDNEFEKCEFIATE